MRNMKESDLYRFRDFLRKIPLAKYREEFKGKKYVEQDLPKEIMMMEFGNFIFSQSVLILLRAKVHRVFCLMLLCSLFQANFVFPKNQKQFHPLHLR